MSRTTEKSAGEEPVDSLQNLNPLKEQIKHIDGKATTALYDSGAELQLISKHFCEDNNLEIHPIEKLRDSTTKNGSLLGYDGYVEVVVQIPGRDFSEDHLFLVTSERSSSCSWNLFHS